MNGITFLLDVHVPEYLADELVRLEPAIEVLHADSEEIKDLKDPDLLVYAEEKQLTLVTMDKKSMPVHLANHYRKGRHTWGVCMLRQDFPVTRYAEDLVLIWSCFKLEDLRDWSDYLPW
jgi:hypothetical protein